IAVSPSGEYVYVLGDGLLLVRREAGGGLTPLGCVGRQPCSQGFDSGARTRGTTSAQTASAGGLALAPDGRTLYATGGHSVVAYAVDADGTLSNSECVSADPDDLPSRQG